MANRRDDIDKRLAELAEAGAAGNKREAKALLAEVLNNVPSAEISRDIKTVDVAAVAAVMDTNHDDALTGEEIAAFARDPNRLDPALRGTSVAGELFKSVAQTALSQKESACDVSPGKFDKAREIAQDKIDLALLVSNVTTKPIAYAIENKFEDNLALNENGERNVGYLSDSAAKLLAQFDDIELPRLDQLCRVADASNHAHWPPPPPPKPKTR